MKTAAEHRKANRQFCAVPVDSKPDSVFAEVRTVDISWGGVGFVSGRRLPLRKKIAVEILLTPDADPLLVLGEVRWVRRVARTDVYRVGMKFVKSVAEGGRRRLKQCFGD